MVIILVKFAPEIFVFIRKNSTNVKFYVETTELKYN